MWARRLDVPDAAKGAEEPNVGLPPMPRLVRRIAVNAPCEGAVEDEDDREHGLPQYVLGTCFVLSMRHAIPSIVWFQGSTTPFYCDE